MSPYKRVVALGDSFTRGDELADCPMQLADTREIAHSNYTWPAIIAKTLGIEYRCVAVGGRGNQWISWALQWAINPNISLHANSLFIINWTYFGRFDFVNPSDTWKTASPNDMDKSFQRHIDSDIYNLFRNLQIIHSTLCLLEANNINFIFTCQDSTLKQTIDTLRPTYPFCDQNMWRQSVQILSETVVPTINEFDNCTFKEWSINNGYEIGTHGHPLEKAHAEAAKYINTNVIEGMTNEH
jgi:hypothetical protein